MAEVKLEYKGKVSSKKNAHRAVFNPRTHKMRVIRDASVRNNEADIAAQLYQQFYHSKVKLEPPFSVTIEIYEESRRRHDLDNQASTILDALKDNVIPEDNVEVVQELIVRYKGVDAKDPRAIITIRELAEKAAKL